MSESAEDETKIANLIKNHSYVKSGVQGYYTPLADQDEAGFRAWVKSNKVPFNPDEKQPDYDMRGFYQALQAGDPKAKNAVNENDHLTHYPDYWKTPYHKSFSNESKFADTAKAPVWNDKDQLVEPGTGKIVFDERAEK